MHVIEQSQGVVRMPPTGKIPQNDISLVNSWILAGAPEN